MAASDGDWQVIARDWWRTPVEGATWVDAERKQGGDGSEEAVWPPAPRARGPLVHIRAGEPCGSSSRRSADDMRLSTELPGVRGASDVLADYEAAVGFDDGPKWDKPLRTDGLDASLWRELVDALTYVDAPTRTTTPADGNSDGDDELLFDESSPATSSTGSLHRSTSTLSSLDFSELQGSSHTSSWSVPATPKVAPVDVVVESPEQELHDPLSSSPRRTITASPIPSSTSPAPSFTFPTLDVPAVKIIKDDQGFYSQVDDGTSDSLLPPFLHDVAARRRRPQSKTRAIVDSLRNPAMHDSGYGKIGMVRSGRKTSGTVDPLELPTPSSSASSSGAGSLDVPTPSSSSRDSSRSSSERRSLSDDDGWFETSPAPAPARPQSPQRPSLTTQRHEHAEAARERFLALNRARFEPPTPPTQPAEEEQPQQHQRSTSAGSQQSPSSSQKGKHSRSASKTSRKHRRSGSKSVSVSTPAAPPEPVPVPPPTSHPIFYPGYGAFMPQAAYGPMYGAPMPPQPPAQPLFVPQYAPPQAMYAPALPPPLLSPSMAMKPHMIKFMSPMTAVPRMRN
ncbi:hypothetical protein GGF50DRAFT_103850 [Schizophyllum commune]